MSRLRADVALVPLGLPHAERVAGWMLDPEVAQGIGLRDRTPSLEKTHDWIRRSQEDPTIRALAILQGGEYVGNVVLDRRDDYLQSARLSIYIGEPSARGVGVGRTALSLAVRIGFEEMGLHKIWLTVHAENVKAIAAYLHVGFQLEGILRDEFLLADRRLAAIYMGLLREDYRHRQETSA